MLKLGEEDAMKPITLTTTIDENHRLVIDVPEDMPVGEVEVTITPKSVSPAPARDTLTHEEIRPKLLAAGLLTLTPVAPPDAEELSEAEEEALAQRISGGRSFAEYIDEDREERL
jgi:hypothetical protein